jgi:conjugative transfer region lipoprotein (TIGR03751 family)
MRDLAILLLLLISISLFGCSSMRGNVVPQTGPSMEQVYDGMGVNKSKFDSPVINNQNSSGEADLTEIRHNVNTVKNQEKSQMAVEKNNFRKLPNPELKMYVFPHLAGTAEIPIPGYSTAFNAYDRDHYALPQETPRD